MKYTKLANSELYIMPFSIPSLFIYHVLKRNNIAVEGFFDNDPNKYDSVYDGKRITPPLQPLSKGEVIITAPQYENAIKSQLVNMNFHNVRSFNEILGENFSIDALDDIRIDELSMFPNIVNRLNLASNMLDSMRIPARFYSKESALIIPQIVLSVTQRCTLKCKDCSNLMQYYTNPYDYKLDEMIASMQAVFYNVDYLGSLSIVGGEPFLYPDIANILHFTSMLKNVGVVSIVTNGTIVPPPHVIEAIIKSETRVLISDYGNRSKKLEEIVTLFFNNKINFNVASVPEWFDSGRIIDNVGIADKVIQNKFNNCIMKCNTLIGRKFFLCSFAANITELKAIPCDNEDFIDVLDEKFNKATLRNYLDRQVALTSCCLCSGGMGVLGKKVPVAIQTKKPLPYKKYL